MYKFHICNKFYIFIYTGSPQTLKTLATSVIELIRLAKVFKDKMKNNYAALGPRNVRLELKLFAFGLASGLASTSASTET